MRAPALLRRPAAGGTCGSRVLRISFTKGLGSYLGQKRERSFADYDPSIRPAQYGFSFLSLSLSLVLVQHRGEVATQVGYFGVKSTLSCTGCKSAQVRPTPYVYYPPVLESLACAYCGHSLVFLDRDSTRGTLTIIRRTHEMAHSDGYSCPFVPLWFNNHVLTCWYTLGRLLTIIARSCLASYKSTLRVAPGWLLSSCVACSPLAAG